jgi:hypothetical protein
MKKGREATARSSGTGSYAKGKGEKGICLSACPRSFGTDGGHCPSQESRIGLGPKQQVFVDEGMKLSLATFYRNDFVLAGDNKIKKMVSL